MINRYFVWITGLRGPEAQIWDEKDKTADGKPIKTLTQPIAFSDDRELEQLAKDYPYEQL